MATKRKFKIIKSTAFEFTPEGKTEPVKGTVYTCGYKGLVCTISTLNFDSDEYKIENDNFVTDSPVEFVDDEFEGDKIGEMVKIKKLVPLMDIGTRE